MIFPILIFSGICTGMILLGLRAPKKRPPTTFKDRPI